MGSVTAESGQRESGPFCVDELLCRDYMAHRDLFFRATAVWVRSLEVDEGSNLAYSVGTRLKSLQHRGALYTGQD